MSAPTLPRASLRKGAKTLSKCTKTNHVEDTDYHSLHSSKVVGEWKAKADDLMAELDASHSEARNYSNERFRLKSALDESNEQLDIVRRENKVILFTLLLVHNA